MPWFVFFPVTTPTISTQFCLIYSRFHSQFENWHNPVAWVSWNAAVGQDSPSPKVDAHLPSLITNASGAAFFNLVTFRSFELHSSLPLPPPPAPKFPACLSHNNRNSFSLISLSSFPNCSVKNPNILGMKNIFDVQVLGVPQYKDFNTLVDEVPSLKED